MIFTYTLGILLAFIDNIAGDYYTKVSVNCDPSVNILSTKVTSLTSCALTCEMQDSCLSLSYRQDTFDCNIHGYSYTSCPLSSNLDWVIFQREVSTDTPEPFLGAECSFNTTLPVVYLKSRCGVNFMKNPLIFKLKVCNYARVNLQAIPGEQYLVDIGSTNSFIRFESGSTSDDDPIINDVMTSCDEARWFWITWTQPGGSTTVEVGTGNQVGSNIFMTRTDVWNRAFQDALVSTMGGNTGYWTFYDQQ